MAPTGGIVAHPALAATSPAAQPLAHKDASLYPNRRRVIAAAASAAAAADTVVFNAASAARSGPAPIAFTAISPIHASQQPSRTIAILWPGIAAGIPCALYFPRRGPSI